MDGKSIGQKYGQSIADFAKAAENTVEDITIRWCNEGMEIMRKIIRRKARTKGAATLAQDMVVKPKDSPPDTVRVQVVTNQDYYDFTDKGVRGIKGNKAPNSPYKFKNLGVPATMLESFKGYIAATGTKKFNGKRLIQKNKKKQADVITQAAKQMAVLTKIGGIKPMNFIEPATNSKRTKALAKTVAQGLGQVVTVSILKEFQK